jgi:hypothetical protein
MTTDPKALTLTGMLRRFCAEERVGDMGRGYDCSSCGGGAGVVSLVSLLEGDAERSGGEAKIVNQETSTGPVISAQGQPYHLLDFESKRLIRS